MRTRFISGGPLIIGDDENTLEAPYFEGHSYNLIFRDNEDKPETNQGSFLFDQTNPVPIPEQPGSSRILFTPYLAPLTRQDTLDLLQKGSDVSLNHLGQYRVYSIRG